MRDDEIDIGRFLAADDALPLPDWDVVSTWVASRVAADRQREVWNTLLRQWAQLLGDAFDPDFGCSESEHFLVLAWLPDALGDRICRLAESCRLTLLEALDGIARFDLPGRQVLLVFPTAEIYYSYISQFYPDGDFGTSGGLQIRDGYAHIATYGREYPWLESVIAHELTHLSVSHLSLPQWIEEGMAQMFEHDMSARQALLLDPRMGRKHKRYWTNFGMEEFWTGSGFSSAGKVQELCYQLSEVLLRHLAEDARPRWFGLVQEPRLRFRSFIQNADAADHGAAACREHLGFELGDLAARFLGPGDWSPKL